MNNLCIHRIYFSNRQKIIIASYKCFDKTIFYYVFDTNMYIVYKLSIHTYKRYLLFFISNFWKLNV